MNSKDNASAHSSGVYDVEVRRTIRNYDLFHDETVCLLKAAGANPALWLDTGGGTGNLIVKALEAFPETRFILADPSEGMLEEAGKKIKSPRVRFIGPVSTQDLDISGETPDVITAIQAHHYLDKENRLTATKKCYDLLKTDGFFISFENVSPTTARGIEIGKAAWKEFQVNSGKTPEEADQNILRFGNEYHPITVEDHYFLYRVCGFRVVELFWYSCMQAGFYCIK